jgi:hypothetical protein
MSWLFSQALVEAFSAGTSSGGEPCAQLNVMPTAQPFWRNDKPMDASRFSRFGLTSRLLTADRGEELLTWFLAAFHARTSVPPAAAQDSTEPAAAFGFKWPGSFAKLDPSTSTWRTRQCSLLGDSDEFSETWPSSGSMRSGECSARPALEHSTSATESGLWPTPTVCGNYNRKGASPASGDGLATAVKLHPMPCARDHRGVHRSERSLERRQESKRGVPLNEHVGGLLNPTWVEWLMGWPTEWTALGPLAMGKFREWQLQHGDA